MIIIVSKDNKHAIKLNISIIDREDFYNNTSTTTLKSFTSTKYVTCCVLEIRPLVKRRDTLCGMKDGF